MTTPARLRPPLRKAVLVVHLLAIGTWIGVDVMVAVLVTTAWVSDDPATAGLAARALADFVVAPMLGAALAVYRITSVDPMTALGAAR